MKFKASLDRPATFVTFGIILLFVIVSWVGLTTVSTADRAALFPIALVWAIVFICFILSPRYYLVYADRIVVKRFWRSVIIPRDEVRLCRTVTRQEVGALTRMFGVGGLFGYFGKFLSSRLGLLRLYATRRQNFVLLHTNSNHKIMLSPDEPIAFARSICS